jgi:hypothetical protein
MSSRTKKFLSAEYACWALRRISMTNAPETAVRITPEALAARMAEDGAILHLNDARTDRVLVGYLVWLGRDRVFCFAANGDDPKEDGYLLAFDHATVEEPSQITFWTKKRVVARLTTIADSGLPDADDFRAGWRVWQQRLPTCDRLLGASFTHHVTAAKRHS